MGCQGRKRQPPFISTLDIPACSQSVRHTVGEEHRQLRMDHAPVLPPASPFLRNIRHGQIWHFQQTGIRREHRFGLGHFPELPVKALDRIGRIDQAAHLLGVLEVGAQVRPILPSGLSNLRIFLVPFLRKSIQSVQSSRLIDCGVDCLQVCHERLDVLVGHIFAGIAELMDDAVLNFRLGKNSFNGSGKAG